MINIIIAWLNLDKFGIGKQKKAQKAGCFSSLSLSLSLSLARSLFFYFHCTLVNAIPLLPFGCISIVEWTVTENPWVIWGIELMSKPGQLSEGPSLEKKACVGWPFLVYFLIVPEVDAIIQHGQISTLLCEHNRNTDPLGMLFVLVYGALKYLASQCSWSLPVASASATPAQTDHGFT